jgi:plastocyanin
MQSTSRLEFAALRIREPQALPRIVDRTVRSGVLSAMKAFTSVEAESIWEIEIKRIVIATSFLAAGMLLTGQTHRLAGGEIPDARRAVGQALGTVEGTVFYRNDRKHAWRLARFYVKSPKSGELDEAVVALNGPSLRRSASARKATVATINQKDMRFVPESVAIRAGDRIRFTNSDAQTHNISLNDPRLQFSDTIASGQEAVESFAKASGIRRPFALSCKFHSQMQGWIYVFDHPFFQMTRGDGRFRLENVPPGDYRLDVAQSAGELFASRLIQVKPNATVKIEIILTPADRSAAE